MKTFKDLQVGDTIYLIIEGTPIVDTIECIKPCNDCHLILTYKTELKISLPIDILNKSIFCYRRGYFWFMCNKEDFIQEVEYVRLPDQQSRENYLNQKLKSN